MIELVDGSVTSPAGFMAGATAAHIKYKDRLDLALLLSEVDCVATAVFTQNQVVAAPVIVSRQTLAANNTKIRAVVANAGNANACTGTPGLAHAQKTQQLAAEAVGCEPNAVLLLSTGVIGVQLPMDKMAAGIEAAAAELSPDNGTAVAQAIMTTDTHPKSVAVQVDLPGGMVTIGGTAKGAGMIHPNMATMLSVVTTDAVIDAALLDGMLKTAVNQSFNRISIDGDTSTNDTVLLLANGAAGVAVADAASQLLFQTGLNHLCTTLAQMIVRDGEGATKFVEINVQGTQHAADAHAIANTIAISPLVKTAFAGSDANWGRLLMAAGRAGVTFDQGQVDLWIGIHTADELQLVAAGTPTAYTEADASAIFAEPEFKIWLSVGEGNGRATVWTSDLTYEYIRINADYRT